MNELIQEKIKETHIVYYKKMNWRHNADCVCKNWDLKEQTYFDSVRKHLTELKNIEQKSFEKEEFKEEELGF